MLVAGSRVLNPRFTPVTHPSLPFVAAPGQLSTLEIMDERKKRNGIKQYFILGRGIPYTLSPALHGKAIEVRTSVVRAAKNEPILCMLTTSIIFFATSLRLF